MTISIALLGAGIFPREEYIPALGKNDKVRLTAIYSRSKASAEKLASEVDQDVDVYYDSPSEVGKSLDDLLSRSDIGAVIAALPILVQTRAVKKALAAGKHVLSEKPIAGDLLTAKGLIQHFDSLEKKPIWMVAENVRFLDAITHARSRIEDIGGEIVSFHVNFFNNVDEHDKFYQTEWRQKPDYQGGFLLDGGVHFIAGLRHLLGGLGQDISSLAAFTSLVKPALAPLDTVNAILITENGGSGTFSASFGSQFRSGFDITVTTTEGSITVTPISVTISRADERGQMKEEKQDCVYSSGVASEVEVFASSIESGSLDRRGSPQQALRDLQIIQGMLESGAAKGALREV